MFKSYFLLGNNTEKTFFRKYFNILTKIIRLAKKLYFSSSLDNSRNDKKKTWDILNKILPSKSNLPSTTEIFIDSQNKSDDPKVVANYFNRFFCSIAKTLAQNFPHSHIPTYRNYLTNRVSSSIFLSTPSINEIINVIYSLNVNKAVGHDNIPAYFLQSAAATIAPYLQCYINFSFKHGTFPDNCTLAKIIPLCKKKKQI